MPWCSGRWKRRRRRRGRGGRLGAVEGLARQLRLVGADALSSRANCPAGMDSQRWMLELAEPGDRLILTCDRRFFLSHCADRAFFVGSRGKKAQLAEVVGALRL